MFSLVNFLATILALISAVCFIAMFVCLVFLMLNEYSKAIRFLLVVLIAFFSSIIGLGVLLY